MREWQQYAACRNANPELFHPDGGSTRKAKALCKDCPVMQLCLDACLAFEEPYYRYGIWGGLSAYERGVKFDNKAPKPPVEQQFCKKGHGFTYRNVVIVAGMQTCKTCHFAARTHCKHGHEWIPENLCIRSGKTVCLLCERIRGQARYEKRLA